MKGVIKRVLNFREQLARADEDFEESERSRQTTKSVMSSVTKLHKASENAVPVRELSTHEG